MQYRVFQNHPSTYLLGPPFSNSKKCGLCNQSTLRKGRALCMITCNQPKFLYFTFQQDSRLLQNFTLGFGSAGSIQPHLRSRLRRTLKPVNIFSSSSLDVGVGFSALYYVTSTNRCFSAKASEKSQPARVINKNDNLCIEDQKHGRNSLPPYKGFNKHSKHANILADHGRSFDGGIQVALSKQPVKNAVTHIISVNKDFNMVTSEDKNLVEDEQNSVKLGPVDSSSPVGFKKANSNAKEKQKRHLKSKHKKESLSGSVAAKSENISTGETPLDTSTTVNHELKKKSGNSSIKKKRPKKANALDHQECVDAGKKTEPVLSGGQLPHVMPRTKPKEKRSPKQLYPPTGKSVVVVESVTKAKVIQGYLGDMFEVLPSYGHIRDLAARSGSVRPDDDFSMVWEVPSAAWTHLKSIKVALTGVKNLILASDPDREGEAIAWHIVEMLQQQDALHSDVTVARVVFHEITEASIKSALQSPRDIDQNLVNAYLARRALDYLIGFNISPLLWRKLPGCSSAGRVQSAALSLISEREMEIEDFKPQEYWTIEVEFKGKQLVSSVNTTIHFSSLLTRSDFKKLTQFSISSHANAREIEQKIYSSNFEVMGSKRSKMRRNPLPPYITSSLQQDAANKLHFPATYTMKLAQKLYEGVQLSDGKVAGLITYIRTDGLNVSSEASNEIRSLVSERYGQEFASKSALQYFKKVKNAQEAHEAVRPTDIRRLPSMLVQILDEDLLKLYTLIWSRAMACQMEPAIIDQIQLEIGDAGPAICFRSTCSRVEFLGYQAVYMDAEAGTIRYKENEGNDNDEAFNILSALKTGDPLDLGKVELKQHSTQPPSRYSEGSLIKKLEELGIGRPSTYATTIKVLQDRNYVTVKSRVLYPGFRGRMVSAFLSHYFSEVTDYSFTADMETELDNVSAGLTEWKGLLKDYWTRFSTYCTRAGSVHIHQVEKMLEKTFAESLFASLPDKSRTCPSCLEGTLVFKVSRFGAGYFIGCDQHPKCKYIARTLYGGEGEEEEEESPKTNTAVEAPKVLGLNPGSDEKILLKSGPYGYYVQLGEDRKGYSPKRASVGQKKDVDSITLSDALELLRYPVTLGNHPKDGQPVMLKLSKLGFAITHRNIIAPIPKNKKPNEITLEKALELLLGKDVRRFGRPKKKAKVEEVI